MLSVREPCIISGSDHNTFDHGFCSLLFSFFQKYLRPSHGSGISTGGNAILQMQGSLTDSIKDQDQCHDLCNTGRASSSVRIPGIDHGTGNDASVAMAEHVAGTEQAFVERMNERAKDLGMKNTHFVDCCGLTESQEHYTTPYDIALMSRELISRYPEVLTYSSVWMEDITHVPEKDPRNLH